MAYFSSGYIAPNYFEGDEPQKLVMITCTAELLATAAASDTYSSMRTTAQASMTIESNSSPVSINATAETIFKGHVSSTFKTEATAEMNLVVLTFAETKQNCTASTIFNGSTGVNLEVASWINNMSACCRNLSARLDALESGDYLIAADIKQLYDTEEVHYV